MAVVVGHGAKRTPKEKWLKISLFVPTKLFNLSDANTVEVWKWELELLIPIHSDMGEQIDRLHELIFEESQKDYLSLFEDPNMYDRLYDRAQRDCALQLQLRCSL